MKRLLLALALGLSLTATAAQAHRSIESCGVDSDYSIRFNSGGVLFERKDGKPASIVMNKGRLVVDGRDLSLSDADRTRIAEFEATLRALVPQAKGIARDAIDIAYSAVSEVAAAFSKTADSPAARAKLETVRDQIKRRVDDSFYDRPWTGDEFDDIVDNAMSGLMPLIIGEIAGNAIAIALSGDEAAAKELERRTEKLEKDIEHRIDTQTAQLASRVAALCPMVARLDNIESSLDLRLDGDARLDLFDLED
jgi:Protein of unknown function (DUF2884)